MTPDPRWPDTNLYYIHEGHAAVYVKTGAFFKQQGGLTTRWGKAWRPVYATSIENARSLGKSTGRND